MMKNKGGQIQPTIQETPKKSKWWLWLIFIIILIAVGIGAYFLLTGGSDGGILGGSSIPQPPALPN